MIEFYVVMSYLIGAGYCYSAFDDGDCPAGLAVIMFVLSPLFLPVIAGIKMHRN